MNKIKTMPTLTPREKEIIFHFTNDKTRKMIASDLKISIRTVDVHIRNIHAKTNTHTIAGIVSYGFKYLKATG